MPFKRRRRNGPRKRFIRRRNGFNRTRRSNRRSKRSLGELTIKNKCPRTVFPWKYLTKCWFNLHEEVNIAVNTNGVTTIVVLNDILSPLGTATTSYGYTDLASIYGSWKVNHVKIDLKFINKTTTDTICFSWLNDTATAFTLAAARSFPNFKERYLRSSTGSGNMQRIKFYAKAIDTLDKNSVTAPSYCGNFVAPSSPTTKWYLGIGIISADYNGTTGSAVDLILEIKVTQYLMAYDLLSFTK